MDKIFPKSFEEKKRRVKILVLGPYRPPDAEKRLKKFRRCLHNKKYKNAKIVADFPDEPRFHPDWDIHSSLKSQEYIRNWGDVLIFVFFRDADNQGVANELTFTCLKVLEKVHFSVVLKEKSIILSSLTKGPIKVHRIKSDVFEDDKELYEKAQGYLTEFVYQLYWQIE